MNAVVRGCLLLFALGFPNLLFALGAFDVAPGDKSVEILGMIFGTVPHTPIVGENPLFGQMVEIFNQGVFGLGVIVVSYTAAMGAINTAHEGQFLGKSWHPILVPLRAGFGILLIVPQVGGFNYIQIIVMWFIVQGIGAANGMWSKVLVGNQFNGKLVEDHRTEELAGVEGLVKGILKANACMQILNSEAAKPAMGNDPVVYYRYQNKINWGRLASNEVNPICGQIDLTKVQSSLAAENQQARMDIFGTAINKVQGNLGNAVNDALKGRLADGKFNVSNVNSLVDAGRTLRGAAIDSGKVTFTAGREYNSMAIKNGWILAGGYYYQLAKYGNYTTVTVTLPISEPDSTLISSALGSLYDSFYVSKIGLVSSYYIEAVNSIVTLEPSARAGPQIVVRPRNMSGHGASIFSAIFGSLFEDITRNLAKHMTSNPGVANDPLISITSFGSELTTSTEQVFFAALGLAFGLWLVTTPLSCLQPLGHAFNFLLSIVMPIAMIMISLLWAAGLTMGIYIPMIPYLVFTFTALGWIILVIEAVLAAPLIALGLIVPAEDEMGKAGHAIVILLGIFLRPALMILGFIMAMQLLIVAIGMLNVGFWAAMISATGSSAGIGVFGLIAVLLLYASVALGMVHEAFSLIYLVPNKVMRWIGGGGDGEDPMSKVKELKGSVQKGAGVGAGLMKSTLKAVKK